MDKGNSMSITNQWIALENIRCAHNYHPLPVVLTRGEGVWVWDIEEKKYLDMMSAYSANSLGHANPRLLKVLYNQASKLSLTSRAFYTDTLQPFLEKLCQITEMEMALPMNTGVEAVETAIKAVRRFGYKHKNIPENKAEIIVAKNNFHGRTTTVISFSSDKNSREGYGPFTPGFVEIPFGDVQALERAITPHTCAFLVEPIQGEAGIILPPLGWLKAIQEICARHHVLLILDEVQSGLGRTGKWLACQHEKVVPDGLILGKALGGGLLPVSMFLANKELMSVFTPGSHGSTFGGNPLASRIGLEVLSILQEEDYIGRSKILGQELLRSLQEIKHPLIKEVRGKGLWVGIELNPGKITARHLCEKLMHYSVLTKDVHENVIRIAPPLIIERDTLQWAVSQFANALADLA